MNDHELLELYFKRDERAIPATAEICGAYCYRLAYGLLENRQDAEECVNDALMRAWNAIPPARPGNLRAYLARTTRRLALDRLEQRSRRQRVEADAVTEELAEVLPSNADTAGEAEVRELGKAVNEFIRRLPEREGSIFIMRCFHAESVKSIARRFGVSERYAANILSRTRKKLKKFLVKEGYIDE